MSHKDKKESSDLDKYEMAQKERDFYERFLKLPESKNKKYNQAERDQRFKMGDNNFKMDFRPRKFFSIMKVEIILLTFGIGFAISKFLYKFLALPFYSKYLKDKLREPDEVSITNIKSRIKSDVVKTEEIKEKLKLETKLKKEYTKDEEHDKIKSEIQKTLDELYGDNGSMNNSNNMRKF